MATRLAGYVVCLFMLFPASAAAFSLSSPEKTGLGLTLGSSYDPHPNFGFAQLTGMLLYDYEDIMPHPAPEPLKFKLEANLGLADQEDHGRAFCSFNFFALYYLDWFRAGSFRPYMEGGVGVIYTDFQVEGQGLRINFNPQAGIGAEWEMAGQYFFTAVRAHHLSNSNLHHDNRGINSVLMQMGIYFD